MNVAIADHRLPVSCGPPDGRPVEVDQTRVHRVELDCVEQIGMAAKVPAETRRVGKERMRCDHQAALTSLDAREVGKGPDRVRAAEIQQQDVAAFDRSLDAGNQDDAAVGGIVAKPPRIQLPVMERNRERAVAERRGTIDQVQCRVGNRINRIVAGMGMELDFHHLIRSYFTNRAGPPASGSTTYAPMPALSRKPFSLW